MTPLRQRNLGAPRGRPASSNSLRSLYVFSGLVALSMVGGGYGLYVAGAFTPPSSLDKETLCPRDARIDHSSYLLIDKTDPPPPSDVDRLIDTGRQIAAALPEHGLLVVAVLNPDDPGTPQIVFRRCAPRSPLRAGADAGQQALRAEWSKKFENPLLDALRGAVGGASRASRSPITATLVALTRRVDFDATVRERKLTIFSDLVEHDPKSYSQMQGGDLMGMFRRSSLAQNWPDLKGVSVSVQYIQRSDPVFVRAQTPAHRSFWRWWFTTGGASSVEFLGVSEPPPLPPLPSNPGGKKERRVWAPSNVVRNTCDHGGS